MCFGEENRKFCHIYDGERYQNSVNSKCDHHYTDGLAIYKGSPFTTGSNVPGCYKTTEIYDIEMGQWNHAPDYPFHP